MPALIRVGHRGAPAVSEDNTLASFDAALAIGVDMIEFDILPGSGGTRELFVAHDPGALDMLRSPTLAAALEHLATPAFAGIGLQLDIKRGGYEREILAALDASGTRSRAWVSTGVRGVLARFRDLAPDVGRGWTVPDLPLVNEIPGVRELYRRTIPRRAVERLRTGAITALVPHWSIVSRELVDAVAAGGGEIYAWTVDDARTIARLAALGVRGVITNDPRLFAAIEQTEAL